MPTSTQYAAIGTIYNIANSAAGTTKLRSTPLSFTYGGVYNYTTGALDYRDSSAVYWGLTADSDSKATGLNFWGTGVNLPVTYGRGWGCAIRCLAKP